MTVLLVTVLNGTGQFTFFTYLAPSLKASLSDNAELLTIVLGVVRHRGDAGQRAGDARRPTDRCAAIGTFCASRHVWQV